MKKIFLLFTLLLCFHTVWGYDAKVDGIYYNLNTTDKTASVARSRTYSGEVVIPETVTVDDVVYSVTSLGKDCFLRCISLTSITIPNSVTSLGHSCFKACSGLTSITLPNSVTSLGNYCFSKCSGLTSITLPNSVTSLGMWCFEECSGLESLEVAADNHIYDSRENCNAIIETATNKLIAGCKNSFIPKSVTSLGDYCFRWCRNLTSITIPNSVTSLGSSCFNGCSSLTSITIPESVTSLGESCFYGCEALTSITIPESVTSLGESCFGFCPRLESLVVAADNPIYDSRENCNAIIETATNKLIAGCKNSTIPNSITNLGEKCFWICRGLTSITIPESVTSLGSSCFNMCSSLTSITIPESVTSLGESCFNGCSSLTSITMLLPTPLSVTSDMFSYTPLKYVYVADEDAATRYRAAAVWQDYNIVPLTTGIEDAEAGRNAANIVGYYDLNGRSITGKQGGPVIVRYSDGSTRKVIAR